MKNPYLISPRLNEYVHNLGGSGNPRVIEVISDNTCLVAVNIPETILFKGIVDRDLLNRLLFIVKGEEIVY